jgi:PAS domain
MQAVNLVSGWDTSPALLVAVALSALYGGTGPGLVAAVLAGLVSSSAGTLLGGIALTVVCRIFRRAPAPPDELPNARPRVPVSAPQPKNLDASPRLMEVTSEATWRFHHAKPLDITLPEDEQVEHLYLYSSLAECNDAFARMYGFRTAADVIGTRLVVFCPPSNTENVAYLRAFIRSGYRLEDAESQEIDRYGNTKYFVNNLVGIFERGQLVGAWGTQRDVTEQKRVSGPQEYRSRIHSAKSSSQ